MVTCLLIYFCWPWLGTVGTSRHPGSAPSSSCRAEVAPGGAVTRAQLGTDTRALCGTGARLRLLTPSWPPLLVPAWDPQRCGSCRGETRAPQLSCPWPGDSGPCHCQPEQGSAGDRCSPGGRACSGRRARGPCSFLIPGIGRAGISVPRGRGAGERRGSSLGNKSHVYIGQRWARWHKRPWRSVTPGAAAQPLLPWAPGRRQPAESPGSASASASSSCLSGFRNAGAAWEQKLQRSRGVPALPQTPSSPRGDPARGDVAAVTALSRGTRPSHGHVRSGCSSPRAPALGQRGQGEPQTPGQLLHPSPPCLPPCPEAAGRSHVMYISREALGVNQCILGEGKFFYLVE